MPTSAMQAVVPVATKISGSVAVQTPDGVHHDVVASRLLHSGDIVSTGENSLAAVELADVGRVIVGPASSALTGVAGSGLSVQISSGLLCVESQTPAVTVTAGAVKISATTAPAIFNLVRGSGTNIVAVYRGAVAVAMKGSSAGILQAGQATISSHDGSPTPTTLASVIDNFASLHCPDKAVVKEALLATTTPVAAAVAPAAPAAAGHGGGVLGWLLGIAAIAAAAGSHGGGANAGAMPTTQGAPNPTGSPSPTSTPSATPTPIPTSSPTLKPTPTPSPDTLSVDPTSLSFSGAGADSQDFKAQDPASRDYSASISNPGVATVSVDDQHGHEARFRVEPVGQGEAAITVRDDAGGQRTVSVNVGSGDIASVSKYPKITCALTASTTSIAFTGTMSSQRVSVSESCYKGMIRARSSNAAVASIEPSLAVSSMQSFLVTARSVGNTTLVISDDRGGLQVIRVAVIGVHPARIRAGP